MVYFGEEETFRREDVAVAVFQKEPAGNRTVCYCFAVSEADLRREIAGREDRQPPGASQTTCGPAAIRENELVLVGEK